MMHAGRLRHRVIIEQPYYEQDKTTGDVTPIWKEVAKVWAEIAPLSAKDLTAAQAAQSKTIARITIRARNDINEAMRLRHNATIYKIDGILPDRESGQEYFTIPCSAGVQT